MHNRRSSVFCQDRTRIAPRAIIAGAFAMFVSAASAVAAQSFFVRVGGNDDASGLSAEQAFATVQRGINALADPGDTLIVGPGRYPEALDIGADAGENAIDGTVDQPCLILADPSGALTGEAPGQVVIDGENEHNFGLRVHGRHHWRVDGLEFRGQKRYGVAAKMSQGLEIRNCVIEGPTHFAVLGYRCRDMRLEGNRILRDRESGHCVYVWVEQGQLDVVGNDFSLRDNAYLSTPFKDGARKRREHGLEAGAVFPYGVVAVGYGGKRVDINFEGNTGSDCYLGMFAYGIGEESSLTMRSNTLTGCYYPLYVYGFKSPRVVIDGNVLTDSFFGPSGYGAEAKITRTVVHNIARPGRFSGASVNLEAFVGDPLFADARAGDFTPGSPEVMAALTEDVSEDLAEKPRPQAPQGSLLADLRQRLEEEAVVTQAPDADPDDH